MSQRRSRSGWIRPCLALIALLMPCLPGCSSCGSSSPAIDPKAAGKEKPDEAKKEKPKEDFELSGLKVLPHEEKPSQFVKPGHWSTATQQIKANNFDFHGELEGETVDPEQSPIDMPGTALYLTTSRPALLPKGQEKFLDLSFFVPVDALRSRIASRLLTQGGGRAVLSGARDPLVTLHPHQFEFVILTPDPSRYSYFKLLDSVRFRLGDQDGSAAWAEYYKVLALKSDPKTPLPLPTHWLSWTTIAGLLIDDFDPAALSPEQQRALVDWLHWGGQILVSGPDTLDRLKGSFLAPYLPVQAGPPLEIDNEDVAELNRAWTIQETKQGRRELALAKPWNGVTLVPQAGATPEILAQTPAGRPLVVEGRAGRGRMVVTAFRLSERALLNWPHFDGFVNGALLRRPPRQYVQDASLEYRLEWMDATDDRDPQFTDRRYDGRLASQLRIFTRDALEEKELAKFEVDDTGSNDDPALAPMMAQMQRYDSEGKHLEKPNAVGVATWNDARGVSNVARAALRKAAGIQIPDRQFVLYILAGYLTILVPVNYIVFRLLGRLEWAWIAVPIIAIGGAATVIKLARLDIGFASSQTELAVLEAHGGYARGHVTRYSALYSSLSTAYDLHFADLTAVAAPFSANTMFERSTLQSSEAAAYRRDKDVRLDNLNVISNSTSMVRAEHMLDLGGAIRLTQDGGGAWRLDNKSSVALSDVRILRRAVDQAETEASANLGELAAGATKPVEFGSGSQSPAPPPENRDDSGARSIDLEPLIAVASDPSQMDPGEVRLVARIAERLPGAETSPAPTQISTATLAVIHLIPGQGRTPAPDKNAKSELDLHPAFDVLQTPPPGLPATGLPVVPPAGAVAPAPAVPAIDPNAAPASTVPVTPGQP